MVTQGWNDVSAQPFPGARVLSPHGAGGRHQSLAGLHTPPLCDGKSSKPEEGDPRSAHGSTTVACAHLL